jgi:hypothetical protein
MNSFAFCRYDAVQSGKSLPISSKNLLSSEDALTAACFVLVPDFGYYLTLKMEAVCSSETSINVHQTTQCHILEDSYLQYKTWRGQNNVSIVQTYRILAYFLTLQRIDLPLTIL